ncbi:MAG: hypothetical protein AAB413_01080 [Patescibacteria group bacterium]
MRPNVTTLINAQNLEGTAGVWGDAKDCHGDVSTLTGPLTNLTGNLSALDGHVHEDLVGDASHLRGDITGLYGQIPALRGDYTFQGHGGDVTVLEVFDDLSGLDRTLTRPVEEEMLLFAANWFLSQDDEYNPDEFVSIVRGHNLQAELIELAAEIAKVEGITIPDSVLMALTS